MKMKTIFIYGTKGGVGKSTIATNLAFLLNKKGEKVILCDMDISGPNIHNLISGISESSPLSMKNFKIHPANYDGVGIISTGLIFSNKDISFFSGKYLRGLIDQMIIDNEWEYDYLIIDLPPGFEEIHQILFEKIKGCILLVTTLHNLAYDNLRRGLNHINKLDIPIMGVVENMSYIKCKNCGLDQKLYGSKKDIIKDLPAVRISFEPDVIKSANEGLPYTIDSKADENIIKQYENIIKLIEEKE